MEVEYEVAHLSQGGKNLVLCFRGVASYGLYAGGEWWRRGRPLLVTELLGAEGAFPAKGMAVNPLAADTAPGHECPGLGKRIWVGHQIAFFTVYPLHLSGPLSSHIKFCLIIQTL